MRLNEASTTLFDAHRKAFTEAGTPFPDEGFPCPKYGVGHIVHYAFKKRTEYGPEYSIEHVCSACGEVLDPVRIADDSLSHRPLGVQESLPTPLGQFRVLKNGEPIAFFRDRTWDRRGYGVDKRCIEISTQGMSVGDRIEVGLQGTALFFLDSDENEVRLSGENKDWYFVLNGYDPRDGRWDDEDPGYVYETYGISDSLEYIIAQDPTPFADIPGYWLRNIRVEIAWGRKDGTEERLRAIEDAML